MVGNIYLLKTKIFKLCNSIFKFECLEFREITHYPIPSLPGNTELKNICITAQFHYQIYITYIFITCTPLLIHNYCYISFQYDFATIRFYYNNRIITVLKTHESYILIIHKNENKYVRFVGQK